MKFVLSFLFVWFGMHSTLASPTDSWPGFRGMGNSLSAATDLPLEWSDSHGILWRVPIDGYGQSSPIIWKDRVFVTTMQGKNKERSTVICYELKSGKQFWRKEFPSSQVIKASNFVSRSAPTPCCDENHVYAFFEGGDIYALTHEGKLVWERSMVNDYGKFLGNHGVGSSLAIGPDSVFVLVNHGGPSYLLACDKATGNVLWKNDYEARVSWSSPVVANIYGERHVVVSAAGRVDLFDATSGKPKRQFEGLKGNTVPSATILNDQIIVGASDVGSNLVLFSNADDQLASQFKLGKASSTFSSPLYYDGHIYSVNRAGVAFCNDAKKGDLQWSKRIGGSCWASHVGAEGRVYFFGKDGTTTVVQAGADYKLLAKNHLTLKEPTKVYGVGLVQSRIVIRTGNELICIGKTEELEKKNDSAENDEARK